MVVALCLITQSLAAGALLMLLLLLLLRIVLLLFANTAAQDIFPSLLYSGA